VTGASRMLRVESVGATGRDGPVERLAALPAEVRDVHRAVLAAFLATGEAPHVNDLTVVGGVDRDEALGQLGDLDLVQLDTDGYVIVAYPFSGRPTGQVVELGAGPVLHAMCAIDALGIPLMTDADAVITSTDPDNGGAIRIEHRSKQWHWAPASTAVLLAHVDQDGPAATCVCPAITFHSSRVGAAEHLSKRAELVGEVLDQATAVEIARLTFAALLEDPAVPSRQSEPR
jgi:hypothetical protein